MMPLKLGSCANDTCAGHLIGDDGDEIDATVIDVDNRGNGVCVKFKGGRLSNTNCDTNFRQFICQYDPEDAEGTIQIDASR